MLATVVLAANFVGGVNFDEFRYAPGPCFQNEPVQMHKGSVDYESGIGSTVSVTVDKVFGGKIGAQNVAIVIITCEMPGTFGSHARLFTIDDGHATFVKEIGSAYKLAADSPFVNGPWFFVTFADGKMYTDRWDAEGRCKRADWISDIFALRGGKATKIYSERHHRAGVERVTSDCP